MASVKTGKWLNKRVLITGHTGFKGVWLTLLLRELGATVIGVSLPVSRVNRFYSDLNFSKELEQESFFDLSNTNEIQNFIEKIKPDFVFHLAAQALVFEGIANPVQTFSTNVMGTINLLDALLKSSHKISGICVVTTDKVYAEIGQARSFRESDPLGGDDPYSASKVGTEMVVSAMHSKLKEHDISISVARAGNVIGGGDWGENRLLPDLVLSFTDNSRLTIRNPQATRPFQHVLDCLWGYILLANKSQEEQEKSLMIYNFGPNSSLSVEEVVKIFESVFRPMTSVLNGEFSNFERQYLELNSDKARDILNWRPFYSPQDAIKEALLFYRRYLFGEDLNLLAKESLAEWFLIHG
jgi:CDP-glucose 4,6-dehydratase